MLKRVFLAMGMALSCLCAAAKPVELPTPLAQDLPVELVFNQQELAVEVPQTASAVGMQFGLIGAIIGSAVQNSQTKKAEARVVPLRDLLVHYHFNQRLEAALRARLASDGLSPNPRLTVRETAWDEAQANEKPASMQALVLAPRYAMTYDFQTLSVSLATSYVERTPKSNGKYKTKPLFTRVYRFDFPMAAAPAEGEDMVRRWSALGSDGLSRLLDQGMAQVADMLAYDFSPAGRSQWTQTGKGQFAEAAGQRYPGQAVRQGTGWVWVRQGKGMMQSLAGHEPLDATALATLAAPLPASADGTVQATTAADSASTATPAATPVEAPAGTPVALPAEAPVAEPVGTPVKTPIEAPIEAPIAAPTNAPTAADGNKG
jgi:hypothetical protein